MNEELHYKKERRFYQIGFFLAIILTLIPFGLVARGQLSISHAMIVVAICALIQVVVHFRYFLHIDLTRQKREDLQLILFSLLLLAIMAGGTIWIMANLASRMG